MTPDWQTNKIYFSGKLKTMFPKTYSLLEKELLSFDLKAELLPKTNDIWVRDFMPIQISDNQFIEYRYDPDYLQGNSKKRKQEN